MPKLPIANLKVELISSGRKNRPGTIIKPTHLTIHNTDNDNAGADAAAHSGFVRNTGYYLLNGNKHWVSWHYSIDDRVAIRHLPLNELAYHAASANAVSIAIEICMNQGIDQTAANDRAALIAAGLSEAFDIPLNKIVTHRFWTQKKCPTLLLSNGAEGAKWKAFIAQVKAFVDELGKPGVPPLFPREELESLELPAPIETLPPSYLDADIDHALVRKQMKLNVE